MGKATRWLKGLFGMKRDSSITTKNLTPVEVIRMRAHCLQAKLDNTETERNKHAIAVAAATAAAADAAVAAAQAAAADVVRLSTRDRNQYNSNRIYWAAIRIQTNFRGHLARKALRALKGLVKIQALVRGYLVRKQAMATLKGMQALFRAQATVNSKCASNELKRGSGQVNTKDRPEPFRPSLGEFGDGIETQQYYNAPLAGVRSRRLSASFEPKVVEVDSSSYSHIAPSHVSMPSGKEWGFAGEECRSTTSQYTHRTPQLLYYHYPSYMAKTESFNAKVIRSQSAPRQRPEANGKRSSVSDRKRMEGRNSVSVSGVRIHRSCSHLQLQEPLNFKNTVMGKLAKLPLLH